MRPFAPTDGGRVVARLLAQPDGGPVRLRTHGRRKRMVGRYASVKSGRALPYESRNELHDQWRAEVCSEVLESAAQPHTLVFRMDGVERRYTPDRADKLAGGGVRIVEVKGALGDESPDYWRKLAYARDFYEGLRWSFHVVDSAAIQAQPQFDAIELIQRYRRTLVSAAEVTRVREHLESRPSCTLDEVQLLFQDGPVAFAKVAALVVRRVVRLDLDRPLSPTTAVHLVE
jgi:hypothetical protein